MTNNYRIMPRLSLALIALLFSTFVHADLESANKAYAEKDYDKAFEEFSVLAEEGNVDAQAKLGIMYFWGWGTNRSDYNTYKWSLTAAKKGNPDAQQMMGYLYENGIYIPKDTRRARDWYKQASDGGNMPATASLASFYIYGNDIPKNIPVGFKLAQTAAEKENPAGMYLVGYVYKYEKQDYRLAKQWFTKSAEKGNAEAANELGSIYYQGLGEEENPEQALFWFIIAEEYNSVEGQKNRQMMYNKTDDAVIRRVYDRTRKWLEQYKIEE